MPWFPNRFGNTCTEIICGGSLELLHGIFGFTAFTVEETEEIANIKKLTLSILEKSTQVITDTDSVIT